MIKNLNSFAASPIGSSVQAVRTSGQLSILRRNIDLAQYVVEGAFTGRQLGSGYFGTVEEVYMDGGDTKFNQYIKFPLGVFGCVNVGSGLNCGWLLS